MRCHSFQRVLPILQFLAGTISGEWKSVGHATRLQLLQVDLCRLKLHDYCKQQRRTTERTVIQLFLLHAKCHAGVMGNNARRSWPFKPGFQRNRSDVTNPVCRVWSTAAHIPRLINCGGCPLKMTISQKDWSVGVAMTIPPYHPFNIVI